MIDKILALFNAVHAEVPDATADEISAVIRERPDATPKQLALEIYANRPADPDPEPDYDHDINAWRARA